MTISRIYVASSWRNPDQPLAVKYLRGSGFEVYDFRNPAPGDSGFGWSEIDPCWQQWSQEDFRDALDNPIAEDGFRKDFEAMEWADAFLLLMPCGRSAHLEAGWALGAGKPTAILLSGGEPELMYKMAGALCLDLDEVVDYFRRA